MSAVGKPSISGGRCGCALAGALRSGFGRGSLLSSGPEVVLEPDQVVSDHHQPYVRTVKGVLPGATHVRTGLHRRRGETTKSIERSHFAIRDQLRCSRGLKSVITGQRFLEGFEAAQGAKSLRCPARQLVPACSPGWRLVAAAFAAAAAAVAALIGLVWWKIGGWSPTPARILNQVSGVAVHPIFATTTYQQLAVGAGLAFASGIAAGDTHVRTACEPDDHRHTLRFGLQECQQEPVRSFRSQSSPAVRMTRRTPAATISSTAVATPVRNESARNSPFSSSCSALSSPREPPGPPQAPWKCRSVGSPVCVSGGARSGLPACPPTLESPAGSPHSHCAGG